MSNITTSMCGPCRRRLMGTLPSRSFSTSTNRMEIPPESPEYIHVPQSLQPHLVLPKRLRGTLPVPREIFPKRQPEKLSSLFAKMATPSSKKAYDPATASETEKRRHQAAELRKTHLREGLSELRLRKLRVEKQTAARSQIKREERARLIAQAEREDERLMSSTVPKGMLPTKGQQIPDPRAVQRHKEGMKKFNDMVTRYANERQDSLHTLYMNARNFIVTEDALDAEIARVFPDGEDPAFKTAVSHGENIWNLGLQPKVADLLKKTNASSEVSIISRGQSSEASAELARISEERVKKLAEGLSGGKM